MTASELETASALASSATGNTPAHAVAGVEPVVAAIRNGDSQARGAAWQNAASLGAPGIKPLAALLTSAEFEVARAAKRALHKIIYYAGRPGARGEAKAVEGELIAMLKDPSALARKEAAWMLSEIGSKAAIAPLAALLTDKLVREDARCALMRFPDAKATAALRAAFAAAPEDFKRALAESLRARGEVVKGYPSQKLAPTKPTTVG